jgi:hypothetical protein
MYLIRSKYLHTYITSLSYSPVHLSKAVESIYTAAFSEDIRITANSAGNWKSSPAMGKGKESAAATSCSTTKDDEFTNHVRYLEEVET